MFIYLFRCNVYFLAGNDCRNAPFLTQRECIGSNCDGLLNGKWHKIKCFPFSISVRRGQCSKWCRDGGTSTQSWYSAFHKLSLHQIYCKNGDRQLIFEVVHCRSFEYIIKSMAPGKCFVDTFLVWSYYCHYYYYYYDYYHHCYHCNYYYRYALLTVLAYAQCLKAAQNSTAKQFNFNFISRSGQTPLNSQWKVRISPNISPFVWCNFDFTLHIYLAFIS